MTQIDTSIRRLTEKAAWCGNSVYHDEYPLGKWDVRCCYCKRRADVIESALTTLATQIREEDARIAEAAMFDGLPVGPHRRGFKSAQDKIAAAIRARQEK